MMGFQDYGFLRDLQVDFKDYEGGTSGFSLCFWFFLNKASTFPSAILHQEHPDVTSNVPFLLLDEEKRILLFPLLISSHSNISSWREVAFATSGTEFPMKKWVHIGCEVTHDHLRLYLDGEIVGDKSLISSVINNSGSGSSRISLTCISGKDSLLDGYSHSAELLPIISSIKSHYVKDPPVQLCIDSSSASEIEDSDGVWSIVGGKASCRRTFSLDVTLMDNFNCPMAEEVEVVASLVYADNNAPVEKPDDDDAPLLASYDGNEYASSDRPGKVISGRASFKLKISQLSSKCDNRLFRIRFGIPKMRSYPFLEVFSRPIRCISRNRSTRVTSLASMNSSLGKHLLNLIGKTQSPVLEDEPSELVPCIVREAKPSPSSKRVKLGQDKLYANCKDEFGQKQANGQSKSHSLTSKDNDAYRESLVASPVSYGGAENFSSESDNSETTNSVLDDFPSIRDPISDLIVFKYCLGDLNERRLLLKEIAMAATEDELAAFAERVSLFSGCSHHRHQISISKRLIEEGIKCWNLISNDNHHVLWETLVSGLQEHFLKMTFGCTRSLAHQDFDLLRRVSACQDLVSQDNFEKLWCWLYPVAFTLSQHYITSLWGSTSPTWIEGFITKEEAESSLRSMEALQEPGTFVLRFPTSRSWPHPDAGNLVVTYVGSDYTIHHRLMSLDFIYSSGAKGTAVKPMQDMLLEQPELRRLGRIVRS